MEKIRYLTILIIILAVLNAVTLFFIWLRPSAGNPLKERSGEDPGAVLARQLGFSTQQRQQFERLRSIHQQQMKIWGDSLKTLKEQEYRRLIDNDPTMAGEVIRAIGEVHRQVEQASFDHFWQALQLCTPQQRQLYQKMLYRAITEVPRPSRGRSEDVRRQDGQERLPPEDRPGRSDEQLLTQPGHQGNSEERILPAQDDSRGTKAGEDQKRQPRQDQPPGSGN